MSCSANIREQVRSGLDSNELSMIIHLLNRGREACARALEVNNDHPFVYVTRFLGRLHRTLVMTRGEVGRHRHQPSDMPMIGGNLGPQAYSGPEVS